MKMEQATLAYRATIAALAAALLVAPAGARASRDSGNRGDRNDNAPAASDSSRSSRSDSSSSRASRPEPVVRESRPAYNPPPRQTQVQRAPDNGGMRRPERNSGGAYNAPSPSPGYRGQMGSPSGGISGGVRAPAPSGNNGPVYSPYNNPTPSRGTGSPVRPAPSNQSYGGTNSRGNSSPYGGGISGGVRPAPDVSSGTNDGRGPNAPVRPYGGGISGGVRPAPTAPSGRGSSGATRPNASGSQDVQTPRSYGGTRDSVTTWRPPARATRVGSTAPTTGGRIGGATGSSGTFKPSPDRTSIRVQKNHRPPAARTRWYDHDSRFSYSRRPVFTVNLGYYDPCYWYDWDPFWSRHHYYYPYYYVGPYQTGYYYSPFWCYGRYFPVFIYPERVIVVERRVYLRDVVEDDAYDLYGGAVNAALQDTLADIKSAWLDGEGGRLLRHIGSALPVRVYQKGDYKYSLDPEDFRDISKDALNRVQTLSFEWTNIDKRNTGEVYVEAKHTFLDPDGDRQVARITYTLEKASGYWWITETGTAAWYDGV